MEFRYVNRRYANGFACVTGTGRRKNMKQQVKAVIKIVLIMLVVFALAIFLLSILFIIMKPKADISVIPQGLVISADAGTDSENPAEAEKLNWYATPEEAAADTSLIEDSTFFDGYDTTERIMAFENDERYLAVNAYVNENNKKNDFASFVLSYKQNGQYSQPYRIFATWIDLNSDEMYSYDCDDAAVSFLSLEDAFGLTIDMEDGSRVYCGFWTDEAETRSLSFAGQETDGVEKVDYYDTPYYFWHLAISDVAGKLRDIDYSSYTFQQLIDALEVRYEKEGS